jgi:hypothetical protein
MADIRKAIGDGGFADFIQRDPRCSLGPSGEGQN